ncbi:hypothetical protein Tco_0397593 [Tanacetum coccineum]
MKKGILKQWLYVLYCSLVVTTATRHSTAGDRKYWCFTDAKKCLKKVRILHKSQENGQTRTRERKSTQRAGRKLSKVKSGQLKSTFGQPKVYTSPSTLIGGDPRKNDTVDMKEAQGNKAYTLGLLTKEAQTCHNHGLPRWQSVRAKMNNILLLGIKQFWATAKAKTVNGEVQIQALVDGKKVIVTEMSVRRALQLKDAEGTECLPNATIFEQLTLMGYENLKQKLTFYKAFFSPQWKFLIHTILQCLSAKTTAWNKFSSTMTSAIICLATNQKFNFSKYIFDNMVKNLEGGVKFLMYQVFLDKQVEGMTKHKEIYVTPFHTKKKKQPRGKQRKDTEVPQPSGSIELITDEAANEEHVPIHSNDLLLSENIKTSQAAEIAKLKERVKRLERRNKSITPGHKRLSKVGRSARIESSKDECLGAQEDASKQGRKIADLDADAEEVKVEKVVSTAEVTTASAITTTIDELTLAQTLIEIKAAKPKAVTTAATTTTTAVTRPKARGVVVQEPSEFRTTTSSLQTSQLPHVKDKGKAKMIEPEKPLKKKDQILIDEKIAQKLQAQLNAELEEEEKLEKQREEDANIAKWDNVQAMIDTDYELAARLQAQEQEELTVEEKSKLFVELMDKRKKFFARLRA